ncbi:hypothetical protein NP233_g8915 [Leucocoprinus birnbaumii]|uniref:Nephrocystin 3-like N-terminal domain-containing protein n=1 Tax=Leucocoprinus birnbaumii TaxID=56174 RepID=A0AAD5YTE1_9AGAR|nr:hypothetical protein NP233_g8915 [Leucocoprinus birnbaumii]
MPPFTYSADCDAHPRVHSAGDRRTIIPPAFMPHVQSAPLNHSEPRYPTFAPRHSTSTAYFNNLSHPPSLIPGNRATAHTTTHGFPGSVAATSDSPSRVPYCTKPHSHSPSSVPGTQSMSSQFSQSFSTPPPIVPPIPSISPPSDRLKHPRIPTKGLAPEPPYTPVAVCDYSPLFPSQQHSSTHFQSQDGRRLETQHGQSTRHHGSPKYTGPKPTHPQIPERSRKEAVATGPQPLPRPRQDHQSQLSPDYRPQNIQNADHEHTQLPRPTQLDQHPTHAASSPVQRPLPSPNVRPTLTSEVDWTVWDDQLHHILRTEGLVHHIADISQSWTHYDPVQTSTYLLQPLNSRSTQDQINSHAQWWIDDEITSRVILESLGANVRDALPFTRTVNKGVPARTIYCAIRDVYGHNAHPMIQQILEKLSTFTCIASLESVNSFCQTWQESIHTLDQLGYAYDIRTLYTHFVKGLPQEAAYTELRLELFNCMDTRDGDQVPPLQQWVPRLIRIQQLFGTYQQRIWSVREEHQNLSNPTNNPYCHDNQPKTQTTQNGKATSRDALTSPHFPQAPPARVFPVPEEGQPSSHIGLFNQASNFSIESMNVVVAEPSNIPAKRGSAAQSLRDFEQSTVVIQCLMEKGAPAAIHNSAYRTYPPRCHEETRQAMRADIVAWTVASKRLRRMRWYLGPAGVGKSAVAQSVAEELALLDRLGATFCFSRPGKIDDPDTVIPTLVYQLAMKNGRYKRLITMALGDDPLILSMDRATQFKALILDPFRIIATEGKNLQPLLIIIDGLDECRDSKAQCELINLIRSEVERGEDIPLLWMVLSRSEWHLKSVVANVDRPVPCQQVEIPADSDEARPDVRRLLADGLAVVRDEYGLPASWPPREQLNLILKAAAGHLGFASFILRFINNEGNSDGPSSRFELCVRVVSGVGIDANTPNPLELLDSLYRQILLSITPKHLPHTMRILGFSILYTGYRLSVRDQAAFFDMPLDFFYQYLQQLHSLVDIPKPAQAKESSIRLYHTSFSDFLRDPARSRDLCLDEGAIHYDVAVHCLSWLGKNQSGQIIVASDSAGRLAELARGHVWDACRKVSDTRVPDLILTLKHFDFASMQHPQPWTRDLLINIREPFAEFIHWLYLHPSHAHDCKHLITIVNKPSPVVTRMLEIEHHCPDPKEFCKPFALGDAANELPIILNFMVGVKTQVFVSVSVSRIYRKGLQHSEAPISL